MRFVLACVRYKGLSGAARALKVNHATVSRRITAAEDRLGTRFFDRLTTGYMPTQAGLQAAQIAARMEDAHHDLGRAMAGRDTRLSGPLRITAPQLLVDRVLMTFLPDFHAEFPDIDLEIAASNEVLDLARREADVAFRIAHHPADQLVGRRLSEQKASVYLSREYLAEIKANPDQPLQWIRFAHWPDLPKTLADAWPNRSIALTVDDMVAAVAAARSGLGATRMPCFLGDGDPQLRRLPGIDLFEYAPIWMLTHPDLRSTPKINAFMSLAAAAIQPMRPRFEGRIPFCSQQTSG